MRLQPPIVLDGCGLRSPSLLFGIPPKCVCVCVGLVSIFGDQKVDSTEALG